MDKEQKLLSRLKEVPEIMIYGAGTVGQLVLNRLKARGLDDRVIGYVVTKKIDNDSQYCGKTIFTIEQVENRKILMIIATMPNQHEEIERTLSLFGFKDIVKIDKRIYQSMAKNYVKNFCENEIIENKKADVLFMASDNNRSSGAFLSMTDLNEELNKSDISTLVVLPEYGNGENILKEKNIAYTYVPSEHWGLSRVKPNRVNKFVLLLTNIASERKIQKLVRACEIKVIHNNTTYTYIGGIAAKKEKIKLVWHIRENMYHQGNAFFYRKRALKLINSSDAIIAISNYMEQSISGLKQDKMHVVYNGLNTCDFLCEKSKFDNLDNITVLMVGTLAEHKGQKQLLEAVNILKRKGVRGFQVCFVGTGSENYQEALKKYVENYHLQDVVCFLGKQEKVFPFYEKADILVVCSQAEPFGRVTIEGQLAGCLVIGANTGATPEIIKHGETGLIYQWGKPEDLAENLIYAFHNPQRARQIAKSGQEYAKSTFTKARNAEEIRRIYQALV